MNNDEWLASPDPAKMLDYLLAMNSAVGVGESPYPVPHTSDRKFRLIACGLCRQVWPLLTDERSRRAVEVAERFADGLATDMEMNRAFDAALAAHPSAHPSTNPAATMANISTITSVGWAHQDFLAYANSAGVSPAAQIQVIRDVVGNPFRPVVLPCGWEPCPDCLPGKPDDDCDDCNGLGSLPAPCPWLTPTVLSLAEAAYQERTVDGHLDPDRLVVLADALEEAGCSEQSILDHLRLGGAHVRGCHVLDLVLGKT